MKIDLECDCGANMHILCEGGADEATVSSVMIWIRMHSLHGVRLIKPAAPKKSQRMKKGR